MKKILSFRCIIVILIYTDFVIGEKHCAVSNFQLSCKYDVVDEHPLTVRKGDVRSLDLSGSTINELDRKYISDYTNVVDINLSNCGIRRVHNGSFSDLYKLIKLNLSDNLMTSFNTESFQEVNALNALILSNNLLTTLDSFRLDSFPKLRTLDLTGNALKYLPSIILIKLVQDPFFDLYTYQNPWDCNDTHWISALEKSQYLKKNFCVSNDLALAKLRSSINHHSRIIDSKEEKPSYVRETCGFLTCKWWIIGSIWIGVILGNLNKLNKLLYQSKCRKKKVRFFEKSVGTEVDPYLQLRQERIISSLEEVGKQKGLHT